MDHFGKGSRKHEGGAHDERDPHPRSSSIEPEGEGEYLLWPGHWSACELCRSHFPDLGETLYRAGQEVGRPLPTR